RPSVRVPRMLQQVIYRFVLLLVSLAAVTILSLAQTTAAPPPPPANSLRGEYGRYRANNDLLFYHLDIRVDPLKKFISGKNTIRFKMLQDDKRIQLDLYDNLKIEKIVFEPGQSARSPRLGDETPKLVA